MNKTTKEKNPLTAETSLDKSLSGVYVPFSHPNIKKIVVEAMEQYAAQQVKDAEENATWAHDQLQSVQEELLYYKDKSSKLNQIMEERDKAAEMLSEALIQLKYLDNKFPTGSTPNVVSRIETFLNLLNHK